MAPPVVGGDPSSPQQPRPSTLLQSPSQSPANALDQGANRIPCTTRMPLLELGQSFSYSSRADGYHRT
jgi:hypothetical protein